MFIGSFVESLIRGVAHLLAFSGVAGLISAVIALSCLVIFGHWLFCYLQQKKALSLFQSLFKEASENDNFLEEKLHTIEKENLKNKALKELVKAYRIFQSSFAEENKEPTLESEILFNPQYLGFSPKWWKATPSLFVAFGLVCTFLGLIAALNSIGGDNGIDDKAMLGLMTITAAKFMMSLTGLASSILLNIALMAFSRWQVTNLRELAHEISQKFPVLSLETLTHRQLKSQETFHSHLETTVTNMVKEISSNIAQNIIQGVEESINKTSLHLFQSGKSLSNLAENLKETCTVFDKSLAQSSESFQNISQNLKESHQGIEATQNAWHALSERLKEGEEAFQKATAAFTVVTEPLKNLTQNCEGLISQQKEATTALSQNTEKSVKMLKDEYSAVDKAVKGMNLIPEKMQKQIELTQNISKDFQETGKAFQQATADFTSISKPLQHLAQNFDEILSKQVNILEGLDKKIEVKKQLEGQKRLADEMREKELAKQRRDEEEKKAKLLAEQRERELAEETKLAEEKRLQALEAENKRIEEEKKAQALAEQREKEAAEEKKRRAELLKMPLAGGDLEFD